jgi:hypothetical protein
MQYSLLLSKLYMFQAVSPAHHQELAVAATKINKYQMLYVQFFSS